MEAREGDPNKPPRRRAKDSDDEHRHHPNSVQPVAGTSKDGGGGGGGGSKPRGGEHRDSNSRIGSQGPRVHEANDKGDEPQWGLLRGKLLRVTLDSFQRRSFDFDNLTGSKQRVSVIIEQILPDGKVVSGNTALHCTMPWYNNMDELMDGRVATVAIVDADDKPAADDAVTAAAAEANPTEPAPTESASTESAPTEPAGNADEPMDTSPAGGSVATTPVFAVNSEDFDLEHVAREEPPATPQAKPQAKPKAKPQAKQQAKQQAKEQAKQQAKPSSTLDELRDRQVRVKKK